MLRRRVSASARRGVVAVVVVAATVLAVPGSVRAASVPGTAYLIDDTLYFTAGAGAVNDVVVGNTNDNVLFLEDDHPVELDPARAGDCVQRSRASVKCPSATFVVAYLGDARDYFHNYRDVTTQVYGQDGNDDLWGWFGTDRFLGGSGDDRLEGLPGHDILVGDAGNDTLDGDDGSDQLSGSDGNDTLYGGRNADRLHGGPGVDMLWGGDGNDFLNGGSGSGPGGGGVYGEADDDTLMWDSISTNFWGGDGFDTINYSQSDRKVVVLLDDHYDDYALPDPTGEPNPHNAHSDLERLIGSPYNDLIVGNDLPNTLEGGAGDDRIFGEGGNDQIDVQAGTGQWAYGWEGHDICAGSGLSITDSCEADLLPGLNGRPADGSRMVARRLRPARSRSRWMVMRSLVAAWLPTTAVTSSPALGET